MNREFTHCDRMMVALARPGDVHHSIPVRLDLKAERIGIRQRRARTARPRVTDVAAAPQQVNRNERPGFRRALAAVQIAQRRGVGRKARERQ